MWVFGLLGNPDGAEAQVQKVVHRFQRSFDANIVLELYNDCLALQGLEKRVEELWTGRMEAVSSETN